MQNFATVQPNFVRQLPNRAFRAALWLLVALVWPGFATGQDLRKHETALWAGGSFANGHAFGFAQNTGLWLAEVRYGRLFLYEKNISFRYIAKLVPLALVAEPTTSGQRYIYGAGLSPIGLQINFLANRRVQPFLTSSGGALYFTQKILNPDATQFNFTVELGAGTEIGITAQRTLTIAYKYHHISNANIHRRNPAVDTHMLWLGFSLFRN